LQHANSSSVDDREALRAALMQPSGRLRQVPAIPGGTALDLIPPGAR
jgi:hypothetical protein